MVGVILLTLTSSVSAYIIGTIPFYTTLTWRPHSSLGFSRDSYATGAANAWNSASGNFSFTKGTTSDGTFDFGDTRNDVGVVYFSTIPDFPPSAIGACSRQIVIINGQERHRYFDILLNLDHAWGNGKSNAYNDYQGVFAHEFGHAVGLEDIYNPAFGLPLPTMYGYNTYLGNNVTHDFRTLENDDKQGKVAIANRI